MKVYVTDEPGRPCWRSLAGTADSYAIQRYNCTLWTSPPKLIWEERVATPHDALTTTVSVTSDDRLQPALIREPYAILRQQVHRCKSLNQLNIKKCCSAISVNTEKNDIVRHTTGWLQTAVSSLREFVNVECVKDSVCLHVVGFMKQFRFSLASVKVPTPGASLLPITTPIILPPASWWVGGWGGHKARPRSIHLSVRLSAGVIRYVAARLPAYAVVGSHVASPCVILLLYKFALRIGLRQNWTALAVVCITWVRSMACRLVLGSVR